jgi:hypothetical protein
MTQQEAGPTASPDPPAPPASAGAAEALAEASPAADGSPWPSDGGEVTDAPPPLYRAVGAPFQVGVGAASAGRSVYLSAQAAGAQAGVENWATRWLLPPLRVALSLPLVACAAVSAGAALYALGLLGGAAPYEVSGAWLGLAAGAAAAVCAVMLLGWAALLRERPRHSLWLFGLLGAAVLAVPAALAAGLGMQRVPAAVAAGALIFVALTSALCGSAAHWRLETGAAPEPFAGHGRLGWLWRVPAALVAAAAAAGAALVAFSLFAASFVPAQEPFALGASAWQLVSARSGAGLVGGVVALAAVNVAAGALFGLLAHGAVRALGWWRGRLHLWWLIAATVTLPLGVIAWLLDSSLPRW